MNKQKQSACPGSHIQIFVKFTYIYSLLQASEQRKADQKTVDAAILTAINAGDKFLKGYLKKDFGLSKGQCPHTMKF